MKAITLLIVSLLFPISKGLANQVNTFEERVICLAKNMYFEARGEGIRGMLAVAHVTLNRKKSKRFPDTICEVVYQRHQFSWTSKDYQIKKPELFDHIKQLAHDVIIGKTKDPTGGALNFHSTAIDPGWSMKPKIQIGNHIFY